MAVSDRIAVMSGGTIVQTGSAEDLYHRPATPFVASFIGRANLVRATVVAVDGARATVEALGRRFRVAAADGGMRAWRAGDSARLLVRPESVTLARAGGPGMLQGTIAARTFLGEKIDYVLDCAGERLQAVRYNTGTGDAFAPGATVAVALADDALALVADTATGASR